MSLHPLDDCRSCGTHVPMDSGAWVDGYKVCRPCGRRIDDAARAKERALGLDNDYSRHAIGRVSVYEFMETLRRGK